MADTAEESSAQKQARLRRERRNAKIQAGGSDRLSKITSMSGRPAAAEAELNAPKPGSQTPQPQPSQAPQSTGDDDPAEVDISTMFRKPTGQAGEQDQADMLRQLLRGPPPGSDGAQGVIPQEPGEDDPMMRMMQQMMGGAMPGGPGGPGAGGAGMDGLPPGLADIFGGAGMQPALPASSADYLWRIAHAFFALLLALYAATTLKFHATSFSRKQYQGEQVAPRLFWMFATAELVLQSTRYFVDGGKLPSGGLLIGLGQLLPHPWGGYIRMASRYSTIYTTVVSDAMVVIFVLGAIAWWKGFAAA